MKKGSCSPPDGKAASQVHFFDRADAGVGLSGEVAANAPLSRDVKEGEPYQIQGEGAVPDPKGLNLTRSKEANLTRSKEGGPYQIQRG